MATTVCLYDYEYNGQVYSPAFSDPPSPKDYNPDSEEDGCDGQDSQLSPPMSPQRPESNQKHTEGSHRALMASTTTKDLWKNKLKRKNIESGLKTNVQPYSDADNLYPFVNKKPKYPTKYHEMLQPLSPVTTFPPANITNDPSSLTSKQKPIPWDVHLQQEFDMLLNDNILLTHDDQKSQISSSATQMNSTRKIEDFLKNHCKSIDINRYNEEGQTPLQRCCLEGNIQLAKLLVKFGAKSKITTRDGFTTLHIAAFSGQSQMMLFIMNQQT